MHRSITTVSPCSRAYAAAGSVTTPDCIHSTFAPAATASSATGKTVSPLRKTSTMSTPSGISCTRKYGSSPRTGPSRFGLTGKILNPKPCSARAMAWLVRYGLSERPTTATVRAPDRRLWISSGPGFSCMSPPTLDNRGPQRREGELLALGLDHHVRLPVAERVQERGPVFRFDGVGVGDPPHRLSPPPSRCARRSPAPGSAGSPPAVPGLPRSGRRRRAGRRRRRRGGAL